MTLEPVIVPIFATPFAVVPAGAPAELNAALARLFAARATGEYQDAATSQDGLCFRSREDLFDWPAEAVQHLKREMLGGICAAVMAVNRCSEAEFDALGVQARARFAIVRPDGAIPAMSAPLASWCAVYCVAAPAPVASRGDSGVLRLYAIREGTMFLDPASSSLKAPYSYAHHVWRPVPGQFAVFPAGVLHEVALNRSETDLVLVMARARFAYPGYYVPPW